MLYVPAGNSHQIAGVWGQESNTIIMTEPFSHSRGCVKHWRLWEGGRGGLIVQSVQDINRAHFHFLNHLDKNSLVYAVQRRRQSVD